LTHERIDDTHSNAYAAWQRMGSPLAPNREQYLELKAKGALAPLEAATRVVAVGGTASLHFTLPRQAVSLLVLEWSEPAPP
jgi:xylan 1,4-beta-xylosidase